VSLSLIEKIQLSVLILYNNMWFLSYSNFIFSRVLCQFEARTISSLCNSQTIMSQIFS